MFVRCLVKRPMLIAPSVSLRGRTLSDVLEELEAVLPSHWSIAGGESPPCWTMNNTTWIWRLPARTWRQTRHWRIDRERWMRQRCRLLECMVGWRSSCERATIYYKHYSNNDAVNQQPEVDGWSRDERVVLCIQTTRAVDDERVSTMQSCSQCFPIIRSSIFMPRPSQSGRRRNYVLDLFVRRSVRSFVCLYKKLVNTIFWKRVNRFWCQLAQVVSGQWHEMSRSKVKVTGCRREIRRPGGGIILDHFWVE